MRVVSSVRPGIVKKSAFDPCPCDASTVIDAEPAVAQAIPGPFGQRESFDTAVKRNVRPSAANVVVWPTRRPMRLPRLASIGAVVAIVRVAVDGVAAVRVTGMVVGEVGTVAVGGTPVGVAGVVVVGAAAPQADSRATTITATVHTSA